MKSLTIALAGNPNSGKTTIFNNITGAHQKVGNWPGVTVEKKEGRLHRGDYDLNIVDLPGTYSLTPFSIEEIAARDFILDEKPDVVVNIIDAANLERSLYLAMQIMELGRPVVFALNMADLALARGMKIDGDKLSELLDLPVVFTVGNRGKGTDTLLDTAISEAERFPDGKKGRKVIYNREIDRLISSLMDGLKVLELDLGGYPSRWTAIKLIENDEVVRERLTKSPGAPNLQPLFEQVSQARERIETIFQDDPDDLSPLLPD